MRYLVFFSIIIITFTSCRPTYEVTNDIFNELPTGAILVRLKTNHNTLVALENKNKEQKQKLEELDTNEQSKSNIEADILKRTQLINKIKTNRDKNNSEIINAFDQFTFCPVYYFYSTDSRSVANKDFNNILLDKNLNVSKPIPNLNNNYLIAEFGQTNQDTIANMGRGQDLHSENRTNSTSMEGGVDALVLLSPEFVQLQSPYPHYVRTFEGFPIKRKKEKTVEILQKRIEKHLNQ